VDSFDIIHGRIPETRPQYHHSQHLEGEKVVAAGDVTGRGIARGNHVINDIQNGQDSTHSSFSFRKFASIEPFVAEIVVEGGVEIDGSGRRIRDV
jgi:hypothetical protein